ncbi:MAG: hypothetical protein ACLP5H_29785 [Desulfomonilaceae bacterium]
MEKRKITAREVLRDVRYGLSDQDLMEKYTLSAQGLQSVFHKLVNAGVITQAELDDRVPISERTVDLGLFICPACGNIQGKEFTTCPRCGFEAPGRAKKLQDEPAGARGKKTPSGPARRQKAIIQTSSKSGAGRLSKRGEEAESREISDPFPDLTRILTYCRVLGVAALVSYVLIVAGIIILQTTHSAGDLPLSQSMISLFILGIPAIITAFIVFVTLRALAESIKIFVDVAGPLTRNHSPRNSERL